MSDFTRLASLAGNSNNINSLLYDKFNVKRGLRNADGTGVLVGLTNVGEVHGYIVSEGEKIAVDGKLFYRGIDVEDIVRHSEEEGRYGFEEAVYLLLFGKLPSKAELELFCDVMAELRALPQGFAEDVIMKHPSRNIMNELCHTVLSLYSKDERAEDFSVENLVRQSIELVSRFPTIVAYAYRSKRHYFDKQSLIIHQLKDGRYTAETILSLVRRDQQFTRLEAETLDLALILHAEHGGGNNSTFAVHLVSSTETDTYSAIAAGLCSLKGFKHGGANAKVMGMMKDIKRRVMDWGDEDEVSAYLEKILRGEAYDNTGLIYGIGHAVYTKSDPRMLLLRDKAAKLAAEKNFEREFNLYTLVERLAPKLIKKVKNMSKDICANVDLYSGFVYKMLDIPADLYTPLFAVSRVAGFCAHRIEEALAGNRIIRPAYKCVQPHKEYVSIEQRE
jgi:citrate synthase